MVKPETVRKEGGRMCSEMVGQVPVLKSCSPISKQMYFVPEQLYNSKL
jgi:hypothetical protein